MHKQLRQQGTNPQYGGWTPQGGCYRLW